MADLIYDSFLRDQANGTVNLASDSFKAMLVSAAYTPARTHAKRSDVTNEVTGAGYTAGGTAVTGLTVTLDGTNHKAVWDGADAAWPTSTITARAAVVYKARGGAATADELVGYWDFGSDKSSSSGTFTVQWNSGGILTTQQG